MLNGLLGSFSTGVAPVTTSYVSIQTATVDSGGASTITFSSIPSTYTHLQIRGLSFSTSAQTDILMRFNSDSSSTYTLHQLYGDGSSAASSSNVPRTSILAGMAGNTPTTNGGVTIIDILDYTNTNKYTTVRSLQGNDVNGATGYVLFRSGLWRDTSAITDITFTLSAGSLTQYSQFALYGIKA